MPAEPPPFEQHADAFLSPPPLAHESAPGFPAEPDFAPAHDFPADEFAPQPVADSYLSAARRSARAAASQADAEQPQRGFNWGGVAAATAEPAGRTRYALIALVTLIAVALVAGLVLSQTWVGGSSNGNSGLGALFAGKSTAPAPQAGTPLHALAPQIADAAQNDAQNNGPAPAVLPRSSSGAFQRRRCIRCLLPPPSRIWPSSPPRCRRSTG